MRETGMSQNNSIMNQKQNTMADLKTNMQTTIEMSGDDHLAMMKGSNNNIVGKRKKDSMIKNHEENNRSTEKREHDRCITDKIE